LLLVPLSTATTSSRRCLRRLPLPSFPAQKQAQIHHSSCSTCTAIYWSCSMCAFGRLSSRVVPDHRPRCGNEVLAWPKTSAWHWP
jgi:hypothetical protein